jgi:hypothetical protein
LLIGWNIVTLEFPHFSAEHQGWSSTLTELLGSALLRLEVARELARVRLKQADATTLERWKTHEEEVELQLDGLEQALAETGKRAVLRAVLGIRSLELEVCEFIPAPREPSFGPRTVIAPVACQGTQH